MGGKEIVFQYGASRIPLFPQNGHLITSKTETDA